MPTVQGCNVTTIEPPDVSQKTANLCSLLRTFRVHRYRITQRKKREVKGSDVREVKHLKPEHVCNGCGKSIKAMRSHCANCAIDGATARLVDAAVTGRAAARSPEARAKHVASRRRHAQACSDWTHRCNRPGLRARCSRDKSSRCSRAFQHPRFVHGSEFPVVTRVAFAKATARIHGIGKRWRSLQTSLGTQAPRTKHPN